MACTSFQLNFYKGDTPALTVSLAQQGQEITLTDKSCKLYVSTYTISAAIQGTDATFTITKSISQNLPVGGNKAWIQFQTDQTKYSFQGLLVVQEARQ